MTSILLWGGQGWIIFTKKTWRKLKILKKDTKNSMEATKNSLKKDNKKNNYILSIKKKPLKFVGHILPEMGNFVNATISGHMAGRKR